MKIVVADKIADSAVDQLRKNDGFEVIEAYGSDEDTLKEVLKDADAVIVRSATKITAEILAAAPRLKAIGRAGVGVDNIDVGAATERGAIVMNTPGGNTIATAELTFTHLLNSVRPVPQAHASMTRGEWNRKKFEGAELFQKTLGVLGLGRIGSEVAKRAKAFGMQVLAYDPYLTDERADQLGVQKKSLDELFEQADFVTVHMPKNEKTTNMINAAAFARMKDGVRIVNCARGGLINEQDLVAALESGKVAAAGLDVFEEEPLDPGHPLRQFPNVVMTPHLGASTQEAQENVGFEIAEGIVDFLKSGEVRNAINAPSVDPETLRVLRPYLQLASKLGSMIQQLTPDEVRKIEITYSGKLIDLDVKPLTRAFQRGYLRRITNDVNDVNAPRIMKRLGIEGDVTKSDLEGDYTELIRVVAIDGDGKDYVIEGTLIGKAELPRLTHLNGHKVESPLDDRYMLVIVNRDVPGIVGMVGNALARHQINISNMSLSRSTINGHALNIVGIDNRINPEALAEIRHHPDIVSLCEIDLEG